MNFFRIVIELFALYLLYKLIFDFIIPVAKTTRQVKKQFDQAQSQMQQQQQQYQAHQQQSTTPPKAHPSQTPGTKAGDYIDFEEIK
jgi:sortase (surface protein transpeptidase)